jgi:predicted Zn-ribbon and HTH transcriptional regulator
MNKIFKLPTAHCNQCEWEWTPRISLIGVCPKCKSPYWNQPKREKIVTLAQSSNKLEDK